MSANSIESSENSANLGQNAQYFSQMATLFVDLPEYSGHSNQFATSHGDFSENSGNSYRNAYMLPLQITKLLALAKINVYKCIQKCYIIFFSILNCITI